MVRAYHQKAKGDRVEMPKLADHDARRAQIADAVLRIAGSTGLHSVTMRSVAAEAGVSVRLVQYYFETKEQLLQFTLTRLAQHMAERLRVRVAAAGEAPTPRDVVNAVLTEALPTDAESRTFHLLYTAYAVLAVTDAKLAAQPFVDAPNAMEDLLVAQLRAAQQAGDMTAQLDARVETVGLLAMSAGLGTSVLLGQRTKRDALAVLHYHLNRIMPTS
ncbi:TetR/AcrR family transcriptional regulator [Dactylosporangium sucinum]|nr:TetR/AcrR family transcriptional regulator [Dactylosporangium sucinum]